MYALWGTDLPGAVHDPALHEHLRRVGVIRLQVNVDDEDVAAAMRIPAADEPVAALVSTWGGSPDEVAAALGGLAPVTRVAGWEVEERRPIPPEETWDGTRVDTLANIALLRRPDELTHEEWLHRWLVDHTPVAIATQGTFGYVQNVVVGAVTADAPAVAALVEELFPSEATTDIHAFYGSGGSDAELSDRMERMMASVARFGADRGLDLVPTSRYLYALGGEPASG